MNDKTRLFISSVLLTALTTEALSQQQNLFPRGDFERGTVVDNLWDGVNRSNQLNLPPRSRNTPRQNATLSSLAHPASVQFADITNDGLPDLVAASPEGLIWVFVNSGERGKPKFTRGEIIPFVTYLAARWGDNFDRATYVPRIHVTNWSSATGPDIIVGTFYGEVFRVPVSLSGGRISYRGFDPARAEIRLSQTPNFFFHNLTDPFVVDWDGDGRRDLIIGEGSFSANTVMFFKNLGTDASPRFEFEQMQPLIAARGNEQLKPFVIDWNGDGRLDLFVSDEKGDALIYLRKPDGTLEEGKPVQAGGRNFGPMASVKPGDFNGDGKFDLIIGRTNGQILVALNTGTTQEPQFAAPTNIMGEDTLLPFERPIGWSLDLHPHIPYGIMDIFQDPSNTPSTPGTGGKCLRVHFIDPMNTAVSGDLAPRPRNPMTRLRADTQIRLETGKAYEISFRYSASGFSNITWRFSGEVLPAERSQQQEATRRGEARQATPTGRKIADSLVEGDLRTSSWTTIRQTLRVPNPPNAQPNVNHTLEFRLTGTGTFLLDDVTVVAR